MVRKLRLGVKDVKRLVDSKDQRNPAQHVQRQGADLTRLVLVVSGSCRPSEESALLVHAEIPSRADLEEGAHRGRGEAAAHLGFMALCGIIRLSTQSAA